ncbi:hypothetical protein CLV78_101676 [Aliiruegeria haliotis]|uniref:Transcriptional regulator n=2 Tax=Aliiruegeria haliotis TaxID=1280846 RepID=A0A2T0RZG6_9RHOB|nr:hypothetical protein CLV78_101676 [Aliiruegeria haliotis]
MGVFRVTGPHGTDRTPHSMKSRGLLALLLEAHEFCRARSYLQDHLWSDRQQEQGASSLRQALSEIRRAFGPHRELLETEGNLVRLRRDGVVTDAEDRPPGDLDAVEYLEGLDIRDPEFERWLRDRRQQRAAAYESDLAAPDILAPVGASRPWLVVEKPTGGTVVAEHLGQAIAQGVSDRGPVEMVPDGHAPPSIPEDKAGCILSVGERNDAFGNSVSVQLRSLDNRRVLWTTMAPLDPETGEGLLPQIAPLIGLGIDRIAAELAAPPSPAPGHGAAAAPASLFATVDDMLRTRGRDFKALDTRLQLCFEEEPRGIVLAWKALLRCLAFGERRREDIGLLRDEAKSLVARAVEMEPQNPQVLALASHVYTFVLDKPPVAHELAARALRIDPVNVYGWASTGYAHLSAGHVERAYEALLRARRFTGEGPHRPMIDLLFGMSAIISGRIAEGTATLETVNALLPDFQPPLRFLLAGYLAQGDFPRAEDAKLRLSVLETGFELRDFAEPDYPTPSLRNNTLLDLKNLPRLL